MSSTPDPTDCLALVGPRCAGKSTLARALGRHLGWPVLDTDDLLGARVGCTAGEWLARAGELAFRRLEAAISVEALAPGSERVVALGGGAVLSPEVRRCLLRPGAFVVFLEAPVASLLQRQRASQALRPALTALPPLQEASEVLGARRPFYLEVADLRVDTNSSNVDSCVALVLDKMTRSP